MVSRRLTPETPSYSTGHTDGYPSQETLLKIFFFCLKLYDPSNFCVYVPLQLTKQNSHCGSRVKNPPANAGDARSIPGLGRSP